MLLAIPRRHVGDDHRQEDRKGDAVEDASVAERKLLTARANC